MAATTTALAHVDSTDAGVASGLINTGHELGGSLGVASVSTIAGASLGLGGECSGAGVRVRRGVAAAAVVAVLAVAVAPAAVPRGRAPATDRPVFVH